MEKKSLPVEYKVDLDAGTFEGYASVFKHIDSYGDVVMPGAFTRSLKGDRKVKMLWQHRDPMGNYTELSEDSYGLHVVGKPSKTAENRARLEYMNDGVVDGLSIGFETRREEFIDPEQLEEVAGEVSGKMPKWAHEARLLHDVELWEVSPVTWGANDKALVSQVRKSRELAARLHKGEQLEEHEMRWLAQILDMLKDVAAKEDEKRAEPAAGPADNPGQESRASEPVDAIKADEGFDFEYYLDSFKSLIQE